MSTDYQNSLSLAKQNISNQEVAIRLVKEIISYCREARILTGYNKFYLEVLEIYKKQANMKYCPDWFNNLIISVTQIYYEKEISKAFMLNSESQLKNQLFEKLGKIQYDNFDITNFDINIEDNSSCYVNIRLKVNKELHEILQKCLQEVGKEVLKSWWNEAILVIPNIFQ